VANLCEVGVPVDGRGSLVKRVPRQSALLWKGQALSKWKTLLGETQRAAISLILIHM
jgi:hypothetical protein